MILFNVVAGEEPPQVDGFLEPSVPKEQVRQDAYPLPKDFEWCILDLTDSKQVSSIQTDMMRMTV